MMMLVLVARACQHVNMKMILDNRQITIREVADNVGISFGSCQSIFTNVLGMKHAVVKVVPKLLNLE